MSERFSFTTKLARLPAKIVERVRRRGIVDAGLWCLYQVSWRWREWTLGLSTDEFADGIQLGDDGECIGYEPIDYRCFDIILNHVGDQPAKDTFLDYGCGKGRAVVLAAMLPFARVIGIELSEVLAAVAEEQVRKTIKKLKCSRVEIVCADARSYLIPSEVTIIFLFNSFRGDVLRDVLRRIHESLLSSPRRCRLVYMIPKDQKDPLAKLDWLKEECKLPTGFWDHVKCTVYQYEPAEAIMGHKQIGTTAASESK